MCTKEYTPAQLAELEGSGGPGDSVSDDGDVHGGKEVSCSELRGPRDLRPPSLCLRPGPGLSAALELDVHLGDVRHPDFGVGSSRKLPFGAALFHIGNPSSCSP